MQDLYVSLLIYHLSTRAHALTHTHTGGVGKVKEHYTRMLNLLCNVFYLPDGIITLVAIPIAP